ncbi:MAG: TIGR03067 domain-containing protein [Gemmatimonadota bacterium]
MKPITAGLLLGLLAIHPLVAQGSAGSEDIKAIQGDWTMVSATLNGQTFSGVAGTRHVAGDTTTVTVNDQLLMRAIFVLNPSASPKTIDYQILEGPDRRSHQVGIYQWSDSTLSFCLASPGGARPTEFESKAGDGRTCSAWTRAAR